MKKFLKRYKHTISLLAVVAIAFCFVMLGAPVAVGIGIVGLWQLSQFARSKRCGVCFTTAFTPEQVREFGDICESLKPLAKFIPGLKELSATEGGIEGLAKLPKLYDELHAELRKLSKSRAGNFGSGVRINASGIAVVSNDCAEHLGSMFVLKAIQDNKIKGSVADDLLQKAAHSLGLEIRAAVAVTDIPLPVGYAAQIVELVYIYGSARKNCTVYPLTGNSTKLPRLKTGEPAFAFIAVSGPVPEKVPQTEWVTFTPGKAGGIVRIPSEIDDDSIIAIGQFVARYIAREMAKLEDTCLFLGDGSSTYNNINGIGAQSTADSNVLQLATTNSSSDKITLANIRTLRTKVTGAVLQTAKYYAHPTMEALFISFNTSATVVPYVRKADGTATFDGFPIEWVPAMPVYSTSATLNAYQIHFGDLSWWYFGERKGIDVMTSRDVYFATDEVGMRALERFDIHVMGQLSNASLQLSAS